SRRPSRPPRTAGTRGARGTPDERRRRRHPADRHPPHERQPRARRGLKDPYRRKLRTMLEARTKRLTGAARAPNGSAAKPKREPPAEPPRPDITALDGAITEARKAEQAARGELEKLVAEHSQRTAAVAKAQATFDDKPTDAHAD